MLPLIMAACGAVGAVVGVVTTQAAKEQDKQAVKRYEKVNAELINSRDKLQQRYYELADRSKQQINELNLKLVESEMEKDVVYLALELYQELMGLREDIDINPSFEVLVEFHKAIILTNYVLKQLNRRLVPVTQDYFKRTLTRIDERDNLSKEQLFGFMTILMNPQEDTISSLLEAVQNEMFSRQTTEVEERVQTTKEVEKEYFIEIDNQRFIRLSNKNTLLVAYFDEEYYSSEHSIEDQGETLGRIEVRASGCYVLSGKVVRDCYIRVCRNNKVIHQGTLDTLKRKGEHVKEVNFGEECVGVSCSTFNDLWKVGDIIEAYRTSYHGRL